MAGVWAARGSAVRDAAGALEACSETGHGPESSAEPAKASKERSDRTWLGVAVGLQVCREESVGEGDPTRRTRLQELKEERRGLDQGRGLRERELESSLGGRVDGS